MTEPGWEASAWQTDPRGEMGRRREGGTGQTRCRREAEQQARKRSRQSRRHRLPDRRRRGEAEQVHTIEDQKQGQMDGHTAGPTKPPLPFAASPGLLGKREPVTTMEPDSSLVLATLPFFCLRDRPCNHLPC